MMETSSVELLWHQFWQVSCVIALALLVDQLISRKYPHLSSVMWLAVFVKCIVPPVIASPTSVFSWALLALSDDASGIASNPITSGTATLMPWAQSWLAIFAAVWGIGVAYMLGSWLWRWSALQKTIRTADRNVELQAHTDQLAERLRLAFKPRVVITKKNVGPAATGILKPTVVLPHALVTKSTFESLEPILAHELVHLRRRDPLFGFIQIVATAAWWFHPMVWWSLQRVNLSIERCVDSEVVSDLDYKPETYASRLLEVLCLRFNANLFTGAAGLSAKQVTKERFTSLMHRGKTLYRTRKLKVITVGLMLLLVPGASLSLPSQVIDFERVFEEPCNYSRQAN